MILSVLDLSPVTGEATQADAVRDTLEIAKADAADAATVHGRLADKARAVLPWKPPQKPTTSWWPV